MILIFWKKLYPNKFYWKQDVKKEILYYVYDMFFVDLN